MTTAETSPATVFNRSVTWRVPIYAIVDSARESRGPYEAKVAGLRCDSLFAGKMGEELKGVAPHVIEFGRGSSFEDFWFGKWGNSSGILLGSF